MKVKDISKQQLHLFASLLHHPPALSDVEHTSRVYCIEPQLDRSLLRPDLLHRIIQLQPPQSYYTTLCPMHKILNAKVVHELFLLLTTEVGLRLNKLIVAGRDRLGHETWDRSILNLRALHGAWLDTEVFWDTFGGFLDVSNDDAGVDYMMKWVGEDVPLEQKKCEACILTRIGSDMDTVFDLEMIVRSRIHTKSVKRFREPRLLKLIEGWLKQWDPHYNADRWWDKLEWNRLRALRLKDVRREIRREEHKSRDHGEEATVHRAKSSGNQKVSNPIIKHEHQRLHGENSPANGNPFPNPSASQDRTSYPKRDTTTSTTQEDQTHSDNEEDYDRDIRNTLYATENDIIDSYAALISTPFLPGMGTTEHQKRASVLNKHSSTVPNRDVTFWPLVANHASSSNSPNRSQSTRHRPSSTYSESVYSQASQLPSTTPVSAKKSAHPAPRRSQSTRERRASETSWVTASVAPSLSTQESVSKPATHKRAPKFDRKFATITEEPSGHRHSTNKERGHARIEPLSPIHDPNGGTSPVSPIGPMTPSMFEALRFLDMNDSNNNQEKGQEPVRRKSKFQEDLAALEAKGTASTKPSHSIDMPERSGRGPPISSRLSRPFDGPFAGEAKVGTGNGNVLDSIRRLRQPSPVRRSKSRRVSGRDDVARWVDGQRK